MPKFLDVPQWYNSGGNITEADGIVYITPSSGEYLSILNDDYSARKIVITPQLLERVFLFISELDTVGRLCLLECTRQQAQK